MEQQLWNLFCETGDPMCYLLYRAETNSTGGRHDVNRETDRKTEPRADGMPSASL